MYLRTFSQYQLRTRPGLFEASGMIMLPMQNTAHWKPSCWVMDVTVQKLVVGSERTGNASMVVRARWAFVILFRLTWITHSANV